MASKKRNSLFQRQHSSGFLRAREHGGGELGRVGVREAGRGHGRGHAPGASRGSLADLLVGDRVAGAVVVVVGVAFESAGCDSCRRQERNQAAQEERDDYRARHWE